ncbi:TIGR04282 family arsenosugar biosynthesis glycosyltransferase [Acidisoma silvae]|uniref:Glycosyltransferase n=1 Tax=Acidisoma silvae TaxID=2802396 RepID=A0A963YWK0_9PROT|nr:TIGR04282 family arsenosugar biosynthesis glycosyltransferase [Acidisoma silvae]MCB8878306.1 glycosyltransferase [Acidisoma silvae]
MTASEIRASENACAIAVMAKTPRPGFSKTRLCPPLTHNQAAGLSAAFLRDTTENLVSASRSVPVASYAAYAPLGTEAQLLPHLAVQTACILADGMLPAPFGVEGFGRSLWQAIKGQFDQGHTAACVLSSDTPTLPTEFLVAAAETLLHGHDKRIVLGACDDGGYYLLGMRAPYAGLFRDITWSTESVADATRARAAELGLEIVELPSWYDVDDAVSLGQLFLETRGYAAPFTRTAIEQLGLAHDLRQDSAA